MKQRWTALRERFPAFDHVVRMQGHYGKVKAGQQAGAVTYYGFLSFFPILALAFFVVGLVSNLYSDAGARQDLITVIDSVLPNIVGEEEGEISLDSISSFSGLAGVIGVVGVLYSGLAWVSALRDALLVVFETPARERPSFLGGKLRDLATLAMIGLILIVAVAVTGFVSGFATDILTFLELDQDFEWVVRLIALVLGLVANTVLFFAIFKILSDPEPPRRSLWQGALLGAVGFEVLKQISGLLLASTTDQPAFQAFGIALILVVWINYFSRLLLYAATWSYTTVESREWRSAREDAVEPVHGPATPALSLQGSGAIALVDPAPARRTWVAPFAAGGAATLALVAALRKKDSR
ncbi:MAG: YihY/virulence factor BrkB family protein [Nocardioides sp.]